MSVNGMIERYWCGCERETQWTRCGSHERMVLQEPPPRPQVQKPSTQPDIRDLIGEFAAAIRDAAEYPDSTIAMNRQADTYRALVRAFGDDEP